RRAFHVGTWEGSDEQAWGNRLDIQNQPIALQLPDWNNWLPDVHPLDVYGFDAFASTEPWQYHLEMYSRLDTPSEVQDEIDEYRNSIISEGIERTGIEEVFSRLMNAHDLSRLPEYDYETDPVAHFLARLSYHQWQSVKTWEVVNKFDLQDLGSALYEGLENHASWHHGGEPVRALGSRLMDTTPFFWPMPNNTVFDMAPHKNGKPYFAEEGAYGQNEFMNSMYSGLWYEVQILITRGLTGVMANNGGGPIDWAYQNAFVGVPENVGVSQFWRRIRTRAIAVQTHNNYWMSRTTGMGGMDCQCGQMPKPSNFYEVWGFFPGSDGANWSGKTASNQILARAAAEEFLGELFEFRTSIPYDLLPVNGDDHNYYEDQDYTPTAYPGNSYYFDNYTWANNTYRVLPILQAWGTRASLIDDIAHWGESMWPNGDWEQWFSSGGGSGGTPPTISMTQPVNGQVFVAPATIEFAAEIVQGDAPIDRVEFYSGSTIVATDTSPPYTASWTGVQPGTYVLRAKVVDEDDEEGESPPIAVSVVEETGSNTQFIPMQPGWNMISSYIDPIEPAMEEVFSEVIEFVVIVRDGNGNVFIPDSEINDIGAWQTEEGYQLFVKEAVTLEITGSPVDPATRPLELAEGWNQIAYLRNSPMAISEALASISDEIVVVKDVFGRIYMPELEIDQISDMLPGQGYKIYMTEPATLVYPPNQQNLGRLVAAKTITGRQSSGNLAMRRFGGGTSTAVSAGTSFNTMSAKHGFVFGGFTAGNTATLVVEAPGELEGYVIGMRNTEEDVVGEATVWDGMAILSILGEDVLNPPGSVGASSGEELDFFILGVDGREINSYALAEITDLLRATTGGGSQPLTYERDALWLASLEAGQGDPEENPDAIEIEMVNFPNPFVRSTTIAYSLSEPADVEVKVIDVLGRLVATLVAEEQESGTYRTVFDASGLASGVYFYRLRADHLVHTGRMTLAR
ncbi:MAG: Ig-like domain-containing protein, partial [Rubricoccaceae bacterium]|nr:Ig-like domain-containing protein [Rubricoccaceae bacterium]